MIIKALTENTSSNPELLAEHGLSLYIEANGMKIMFDTGQSSAFAQNADTMGVDLSQVDFAVLSHAHYDHSGGLQTFLDLNAKAPVYISAHAFDEYFNAAGKPIGPDQALLQNPRIVTVKDGLKLADGVTLYPADGRNPFIPVNSAGLLVRRDGKTVPDDFRHEQYLEIVENGRRVLISGCSHKGIVNIVHWFKPDVLIGGFHLMNLDPEDEQGQAMLQTVAAALAATNTVYYTCHCTGVPQYETMKRQMLDTLFYISAGEEITV